MDIPLTRINQSGETASVVIFQHNKVKSLATVMIAWQMAENLAPTGSYPFTFSASLQVSGNTVINIKKTLSLENIASADILMTGSATPFEFSPADVISTP